MSHVEDVGEGRGRDIKAQWDIVRLQPIAEPLYDLAKETLEQGLGDEVVVDRIKALLTQK